MKKIDLSIIFLRLLGLGCIILTFLMIATADARAEVLSKNEHWDYGSAFIRFAAPHLALLLCALVLLFCTAPLAAKITPGDPQDIISTRFRGEDLQAIAFAVLGAYLLIQSVVALGHWISAFSKQTSDPYSDGYIVVKNWIGCAMTLLRGVMGVWLFCGAKGLSRFWPQTIRPERGS